MPFLRDEHGRLVRRDGTVVERAVVRRGPRAVELSTGGRVSHLRVDQILGGSGEMRDAYEALLDTPSTYLKDLQAFFLARGHRVTLSAINRHRKRYHAEFSSVREAAKMAAAFCAATRRDGPGALAEAAQGRFEMLLMQDLFKLKENPALAPEEWQRWSRAVSGAVATRRKVEEMREEFERKAAEAAKVMEELNEDPQERNRQVVYRVREILGMPPHPDQLRAKGAC
jgi:hypothetical protein